MKGEGKLELPNLISNHMVLQAGKPVKLWGKDVPGQRVTAEIEDSRAEAVASKDGKWEITLPKLEPGGPFSLLISGSGKVVIQDVVVGEVWLAGGQSNMQWTMGQIDPSEEEVSQAQFPELRFFNVHRTTSSEIASDVQGQWVICSPDTVRRFSAVAYYFARDLIQKLQSPVGIISSNYGGTPVQAWMPEAKLKKVTGVDWMLKQRNQWMSEENRQAGYQAQQAWLDKRSQPDPGNEGEAKGWANADFEDKDWKTLIMPGIWERQGLNLNGVVWLRQRVDVPKAWVGQPLSLQLATWGDTVTAYWNGKQLDPTRDKVVDPSWRDYHFLIPTEDVKEGTAVLALRMFDANLRGGIRGHVQIKPAKGAKLDLRGKWKYQVGKTSTPLSKEARKGMPQVPNLNSLATLLYRGMIAPVLSYTIQGVIWYQGEANTSHAPHYTALFSEMIAGWRENWGQGDFPFYYVQLANFMARHERPTESNWAALREAQRLTEEVSPQTGMAVAIDIGEADDIHPKNKKDVGLRLARLARARTYGEKGLVDSGPVIASAAVGANGTVTLTLKHATGLKTTDGQAPLGFALAGEDRKFHWAEAKIEGEKIVLACPAVKAPRWLRYAWANNPAVNLVNGAGLPAVPMQLEIKP